MFLEIVTPEKKIFEGEADSAIFPGADGSFQILNNHAPLISSLKKGIVRVKDGAGKEHRFEVKGGTVEVFNNKVTILAE